MSATEPPAPPRVRLTERGPMLIDGPVDLLLPDGTELHCDRPVVAVCTCRRSHRYPLCDTSHRRRGRPASTPTPTPAPTPSPTPTPTPTAALSQPFPVAGDGQTPG